MINVAIDPMMFSIIDIEHIDVYFSFYLDLFTLLREHIARICYYPDMDKLFDNHATASGSFPPPFPFDLQKIKNDSVRETGYHVNRLFAGLSTEDSYKFITDIDECSGDQNCRIFAPYDNDSLISELSFYLLSNCYKLENGVSPIDSHILSGCNHLGEKLRPADLQLQCYCETHGEHSQRFEFVMPKFFFRSKDYAIEKLRKLNAANSICNTIPSIHKDGGHHVYIQEKGITKYSDLTPNNRSVLKLLQNFNLIDVHLRESVKGLSSWGPAGDLKVLNEYEPCDTDTIIPVLICGETGVVAKIQLEFPEGVGALLITAIGKDWSRNAIRKLADKVIS